ncbi:MAG: BadF/BadG/BcrA/BcrD ATPase family protein [Acidobacteriota bacterium]
MLTAGVDVGSSSVKVAVLQSGHGPAPRVAALGVQRYRRRTPGSVVENAVAEALARAGAVESDLAYLATTGEGDLAPRRHGHFYGMTAHGRGALFLCPEARSVLDGGALHARAIKIDPRGRVLGSRMTSQCASGSGQFIENIARYLGVALEDVGPLSLSTRDAEPVSGICAVLAETDVINMVARGVPAAAILKGIHASIASRLAKLLRSCHVDGPVAVTGGMAADAGLLAALRDQCGADRLGLEVLAPDDALYAGAIGAAIWGAFRADSASATARAGAEEIHAGH